MSNNGNLSTLKAFSIFLIIAGVSLLPYRSTTVWGLGGCGSGCVPIHSRQVDTKTKTELDKKIIKKGKWRILSLSEYANFNDFYAETDHVDNAGGNRAKIGSSSLAIEYGLAERITTTLLIPYVHKEQETNRFDKRIGNGIGDIAFLGDYELFTQEDIYDPSFSLGLGIRFPTGSIDEPGEDRDSKPKLPPAFQVGTGAYALIFSSNFFKRFKYFNTSFNFNSRLPLEENKRDYRFGREYEFHARLSYPLPILEKRVELLIGFGYLHQDHDRDRGSNIPARMTSGKKVLNTGGDFLNFEPGMRFHVTENLSIDAQVGIPVFEDWNGDRNPPDGPPIGQVRPDAIFNLTLVLSL